MKHYHCDRCGEEIFAMVCDQYGYGDLCFDCKAVMDALKSWDQYIQKMMASEIEIRKDPSATPTMPIITTNRTGLA